MWQRAVRAGHGPCLYAPSASPAETAKAGRRAADTIRVNHLVHMLEGFSGPADRLAGAGSELRDIGSSVCAKLDGGTSCLGLRFTLG